MAARNQADPGPTKQAGEGPHPLTRVMAERQRRLLEALRCPRCRGVVEVLSAVTTSDGRIKTGAVRCPLCHVEVASIRTFQVVFAEISPAGRPAELGQVGEVGEIGEQRISPADDVALATGWDVRPGLLGGPFCGRNPGVERSLHGYSGPAGRAPAAGVLDVAIDGVSVAPIDTRSGPGSVSGIIDIATDLELASHELVLTIRDVEPDGQVLIQELVLLGPIEEGSPFEPPAPFARGNAHSDRILRHVRRCEPSQLVLECGGGDRRPDRPNYINLEFLPYEGADLRRTSIGSPSTTTRSSSSSTRPYSNTSPTRSRRPAKWCACASRAD